MDKDWETIRAHCAGKTCSLGGPIGRTSRRRAVQKGYFFICLLSFLILIIVPGFVFSYKHYLTRLINFPNTIVISKCNISAITS